MIGNQSVTVQPKLWKNGSDASTPSSGVEVHHHAELGDVGQDVAVAEHDALRLARTAAGKEQHGLVVAAALAAGRSRRVNPHHGITRHDRAPQADASS